MPLMKLNDLVENYENTFYLLGSAVGPHPYPTIVKHFQAIISEESKRQIFEKEGTNYRQQSLPVPAEAVMQSVHLHIIWMKKTFV